MVEIINLRFEHHGQQAIGIGQPSPRISWSFEQGEEDSAWYQQSYELEVSRDGAKKVYAVDTAQSLLVDWPCSPLKSAERAGVRVRATSTSGQTTPWSSPSIVELGLLNRADWKCSLIESGDTSATESPHMPLIFRRELEAPASIHQARLYVTAHGVYEARINGKKAGDHLLAPGWTSYKYRIVYQTFDVTALVQPGVNKLDVEVADGWFCGRLGYQGGRPNIYGDRLGVMAMLVIESADGQKQVVGTDDRWNCAHGPTLAGELYNGETYDSRQELSDQTAWAPVRSQPLADTLVAPEGPPIRITQEIKPREIFRSSAGKTLVDFGQNFVGWVRLKVEGPSGTRIQIKHAEVLENKELGTRPLRYAKATDVLILSGQGPMVWEPKFTCHGFRYVEVVGWPGELSNENLTGIVIHTDMQRTGYFECSNQLLNQLHQNVVWSMRGNFVGLPTDCPQRDERLGWAGDINVFSDTANFLYDSSGLLISWLQDVVAEQAHTAGGGIVPLVVPNLIEFLEKDAHAVWGDVAVMLPWSLYRAYGDAGLLKRQYDSMKAWINIIPRRGNGLWDYLSTWKLGDWLDPAAPPDDAGNGLTDPEFVSNFFLIHITDVMARAARVIGREADATSYEEQATKLRTVFCHEYMTPSGRLAADTQTAIALGIHFDVFPTSDQEQCAAEQLERIIRRKNRFSIATGFAGTPYIGHALTKMKQSNLFYRMLLHRQNPSWLYPVTMGATTVWERWDSMLPDGSINPGEMTSFNHYALGAVADWMHSHIIGLSPLEPGWRVFKVEPVPGGGLKWAQGKYLSSYGECKVSWKIIDGKNSTDESTFRMQVTVPPNTTAHVKLPGEDSVSEVSSGRHTFESRFLPDEWPPQPLMSHDVTTYKDLPDDPVLPTLASMNF